jgi:FMN phosphatase YigB (HAD superfamily)
MLQKLNCEARECLFIDDTRVNVIEAGNLGFYTILAFSTRQIVTSLKEQGIID